MFGKIDMNALYAALSVMGKGMLGIFAVMIVITFLVLLFTKFTKS